MKRSNSSENRQANKKKIEFLSFDSSILINWISIKFQSLFWIEILWKSAQNVEVFLCASSWLRTCEYCGFSLTEKNDSIDGAGLLIGCVKSNWVIGCYQTFWFKTKNKNRKQHSFTVSLSFFAPGSCTSERLLISKNFPITFI